MQRRIELVCLVDMFHTITLVDVCLISVDALSGGAKFWRRGCKTGHKRFGLKTIESFSFFSLANQLTCTLLLHITEELE